MTFPCTYYVLYSRMENMKVLFCTFCKKGKRANVTRLQPFTKSIMKYICAISWYWSSYITIMILVVNVKFIWKNEIFYFIPYVPFKIIGGQISHTWVMFPHLGIHTQSFTHLLVLNINFLTLLICMLHMSQQTSRIQKIFILFTVSEIVSKIYKMN